MARKEKRLTYLHVISRYNESSTFPCLVGVHTGDQLPTLVNLFSVSHTSINLVLNIWINWSYPPKQGTHEWDEET